MSRPPADDDALLERLRSVLGEVDPAPPLVLAAARESFAWRDVDAELARLVADSADEPAVASATRGRGAVRHLAFAWDGERELELEVSHSGSGTRRIIGQLLPPAPAPIELQHAGGVLHTSADEHGRFAADAVAAGPVRLTARLPGPARPAATPWLRV
jgi:hypothetical protein